MEKHIAAQVLFDQGVSGKDIAVIFEVSEQTISSWRKKYKWDKKRTQKILDKETAEESLWDLINYQLKVLQFKKNKMLEEPEDDQQLINKGDIDALSKMFSAIKGKQLEWGNYVKIIKELLEYVSNEDLSLAKQMSPMLNAFLNQKQKEL